MILFITFDLPTTIIIIKMSYVNIVLNEYYYDFGIIDIIYVWYLGTVEVVSLHTLRLESLKRVFQPLHKCIVNKLEFWQIS